MERKPEIVDCGRQTCLPRCPSGRRQANRPAIVSAFLPERIKYDGSQIKSLWAYKDFGILGDSIISFIGPCDIPQDAILDVEDVRAKNRIFSPLMLHFIIEHFETDLDKAILRQLLLTTIIKDIIEENISRRLKRVGDDLYSENRRAKLSISIASASPVSTKIHFGINIKTKGTPVKTIGLENYRINPKQFALKVMQRYIAEMESVRQARQKVYPCT
ncbi:MAG: DUF366 family protein [Planctomycetota bacterium]|nr:DUF366 family protein [Planctomycetota bacterium]MDI6787022.1 DUF366 family protein [Planctomycetota bacterium]